MVGDSIILKSFPLSHFGNHDLSYIAELLSDDIHVHLPVEGAWGSTLPFLFSFNGSSYKWTNFTYHGVRINNPLIPGDAMYHFNLSDELITMDRYQKQIQIEPGIYENKAIKTRLVKGNTGSRVGFADWFINNISGHNSAQQRAIKEIDSRIHVPWQLQLNAHSRSDIAIPFELTYIGGTKQHIDQDFSGKADNYEERHHQFTARLSWGEDWHSLLEWRSRSNFFSELNYNIQETGRMNALNWSLYRSSGNKLGVHFNFMGLEQVNPNFSRNVIDQDGEGLFPYYPDGIQFSITPFYADQFQLNNNENFTFNLDIYNSWIRHNPDVLTKENAIYYQSQDTDYRSLHTITWETQHFSTVLINNNASLRFKQSYERTKIQLNGGLKFLGIIQEGENLLGIYPFIDLGLEYNVSSALSVGIRAGTIPEAYDLDQARFISHNYMNGIARYWNDNNTNRAIENEEVGEKLFTTGGRYRTLSDELGPAITVYLDAPIVLDTKNGWKFSILPQFRSYRNTWDVQYSTVDGIVERSGEGQWYYIGGKDIHYEVVPYDQSWMVDSEGNSRGFLFNQPFYAGVTLEFMKDLSSWFIQGSATAHMVVGGSSMGNGPLHSNFNQPSDAMADMNLRFGYLGRMDADRSYLANFLIAHRYHQQGSFMVFLRYRDGQSFGYYQTHLHENAEGTQVAFNQPLPRGDDPFTGLMGRREDFLLNAGISWMHRFKLNKGCLNVQLQGQNLLDFATEQSEYVYGVNGDFLRAPLELQIPRSFILTIGYEW